MLKLFYKNGDAAAKYTDEMLAGVRTLSLLGDDAIELTNDISTRLVRAESKSGTQYLDVVIHGDGNKFVIDGQSYSGTDLAEIIRAHNPNNQPIRLLSCSNLESAQEIARHLNTEVIANNGITRLHADGGITAVSKADGTPEPWQRIGPDGNVKDADINFNSQTTQPDEYISLGKKGDELGGSLKSIDEIVASVEPEYQAALRTFLESSEEAAEAFGRNPGLVDGWKMFKDKGLDDFSNSLLDLQIVSDYMNRSGKAVSEVVKEVPSSSIDIKRWLGDLRIEPFLDKNPKIFDLSPPDGYQIYEVNGSQYIRRVDINNPYTPRLMVDENGVVVKYTKPARMSVSARFRKNLEEIYGKLPTNHQRHHLVPDNVVRNSPLHQEAIRRGLYNVDQGGNGRYLAETAEDYIHDLSGLSSNFPTHLGSHPNYDVEIRAEIQDVVVTNGIDLSDLSPANMSDEDLMNFIYEIEDRALDVLEDWIDPRLN